MEVAAVGFVGFRTKDRSEHPAGALVHAAEELRFFDRADIGHLEVAQRTRVSSGWLAGLRLRLPVAGGLTPARENIDGPAVGEYESRNVQGISIRVFARAVGRGADPLPAYVGRCCDDAPDGRAEYLLGYRLDVFLDPLMQLCGETAVHEG